MKKRATSILLALSLLLTPQLRAEETTAPSEPTPPPRQVGRASADGVDLARQRNLGNITIALIAVAIAVTAIILVSKHDGKHSKSH